MAKKNSIWFLVLAILSLGVAGCGTMTVIDFATPEGSKMTLKEQVYTFPVAVPLTQKTERPLTVNGYPIQIDIVDADSPGGILPVSGFIYVYETELSDVDLMARNYFRIPAEKILALKQGAAVIIEGFSADANKPLYRAVLGVKKEGN